MTEEEKPAVTGESLDVSADEVADKVGELAIESAKAEPESTQSQAVGDNSSSDQQPEKSEPEVCKPENSETETVCDPEKSESNTVCDPEKSESEPNAVEDDKPEANDAKDLDDDEIEENPAYIPKKGKYYMHDSRDDDGFDEEESKKSRADGAWKHDRFDERSQRPKSKKQLQNKYGSDFRPVEAEVDDTTGNATESKMGDDSVPVTKPNKPKRSRAPRANRPERGDDVEEATAAAEVVSSPSRNASEPIATKGGARSNGAGGGGAPPRPPRREHENIDGERGAERRQRPAQPKLTRNVRGGRGSSYPAGNVRYDRNPNPRDRREDYDRDFPRFGSSDRNPRDSAGVAPSGDVRRGGERRGGGIGRGGRGGGGDYDQAPRRDQDQNRDRRPERGDDRDYQQRGGGDERHYENHRRGATRGAIRGAPSNYSSAPRQYTRTFSSSNTRYDRVGGGSGAGGADYPEPRDNGYHQANGGGGGGPRDMPAPQHDRHYPQQSFDSRPQGGYSSRGGGAPRAGGGYSRGTSRGGQSQYSQRGGPPKRYSVQRHDAAATGPPSQTRQQFTGPRQPTDVVYFDPSQQTNRMPPAPREKKIIEIVPPTA